MFGDLFGYLPPYVPPMFRSGLHMRQRDLNACALEGLLLETKHTYTPKACPVRVCVYCAVTGSFNSVWVPWVTVVESLVQVTVVAGPPVEIQVRVN